MTKERKTRLKEQGFLVAAGRYVSFVHEFSSHDNKGMRNYFAYKEHVCNKTDNGTCNFAHIRSFQRLPLRDKNAPKAWVRDTPGVSFADGQGPTNSG